MRKRVCFAGQEQKAFHYYSYCAIHKLILIHSIHVHFRCFFLNFFTNLLFLNNGKRIFLIVKAYTLYSNLASFLIIISHLVYLHTYYNKFDSSTCIPTCLNRSEILGLLRQLKLRQTLF